MTVLPLRPTTISDLQAGDYPYTPRASEFRSDVPPPGISSAVATGSAASVNVAAMAHPPLQKVTSSLGTLVAVSCVVLFTGRPVADRCL